MKVLMSQVQEYEEDVLYSICIVVFFFDIVGIIFCRSDFMLKLIVFEEYIFGYLIILMIWLGRNFVEEKFFNLYYVL